MALIDDSEYEIVQLDEQTENIARILTLVFKHVKPGIDCGQTYEFLVHLLVKFLYEEVTDDDATVTGKNILATVGGKKQEKH
jgi:hypothetical protein